MAGARVLTTVGSWEKAERTRTLGADLAINYREQDFVAEVLKATGNKGVQVIIENVATDNLAKDFGAISANARIVVIGTGTGKSPDATFPVFGALSKDASILGMSLINAGAAIPEMERNLFICLLFLFRRRNSQNRQSFLGNDLHCVLHGNLSDTSLFIDPAELFIGFRIFLQVVAPVLLRVRFMTQDALEARLGRHRRRNPLVNGRRRRVRLRGEIGGGGSAAAAVPQ